MRSGLWIPAVVLAVGLATVAPGQDSDVEAPGRRLATAQADHAHRSYARCLETATAFRDAVHAFVAAPSDEGLATARRAWIAARDVYGTTEVLRFQDGPIDNRKTGVETWLNAWPVDESYIDRVPGAPAPGIIQDTDRFPNLSTTLLTFANEKGGEANVSIGWHAAEFLLWGQDLDPDGPGTRPFTDYVVGEDDDAARRGVYLRLVADLIVEHLTQLRDAWAPDVSDNYRATFLTLPDRDVVTKMLTGMVVLSGFEMAGERMAVAYETQDQEDEHSCFSDTTHRDFIANQAGIAAVWHGVDGRPGLAGHAARVAPAAAAEVTARIAAATQAIAAIPAPFDTAVRGDDDAPGRRAVLAAIVALEQQAEALAALGLELELRIPLRPGG